MCIRDSGDTDDADDLTSGGIKWKPNQYIPQPTNVSIGKKSTLKDEYRGKFRTELSSFLAFFPIEFWQLYLERTNVYGFHLYNTAKQTAEQRGSIYGGRKWVDATLKEFMTFFGMLIEMTTCPTPGLSYPNRWNLRGHDYTKIMSLDRFKDLRSALQMSDNFSGSGTGLPPVSYTHLTLPTIYSV